MFELIVAMDKNNGIGYENNLPWYCKEEIQLFKKKTENNAIVFGSKTLKTLPILSKRDVYCLSRRNKQDIISKNEFVIINNLDQLKKISNKKIFIAGGNEVYNLALSTPEYIKTIHLSIMKDEYKCDTYFNKNLLDDFVIISETDYEKFTHYVMKRTNNGERQYLNLLNNIVNNGIERTGRNGNTMSLFTEHFKFDLRNGFPLLTTKKMFLRGIIEEFLFFLRGETNSNILSDKKVRIWEGNTSKEFIKNKGLNYAEGVMGPMYGYQWRKFGQKYIIDNEGYPDNSQKNNGIDQLENVVNLIKENPHSRRILMTSYNPLQAEEGVLYPCHSIALQFYVDGNYLDMFCFNRSQDTFLGVPYNIASSSLLLIIIGKLTGKTPRFFNMTMGDTHLYKEHLESSKEQCSRIPYYFPNILIPDIENISDINNLKYEDFSIIGYNSHNTIKAKMIA